MTILTLNKPNLEKLVGKITHELETNITDMGTPIEEVTDSELSVEVFPNRPDVLSLRNFARTVNQYNGKSGLVKFNINSPEKDYTVTVDKSVKDVRPYTVCAIVKKLKLNPEKIAEIIDIQEKLHSSIGRKRRKVAIGIYPLDKITLPIKLTGKKPEDIKFIPLDSDKEMTANQILKSHPKGRDYAHLLKEALVYPVFMDASDKILSMPPIINSEETGKVDESTNEVFIECSGTNLHYLNKALNILLFTLSEIGGKIYSMQVKGTDGKIVTTPEMDARRLEFKISDIEKTLGISLSEKEVKKFFGMMGHGFESSNGKTTALVPCYRVDILHPIDLAEEVAIAYGYENFVPEIPDISTIGEEDKTSKLKKTVGDILAGLGLLEASSYHLTNKKNIKKMHFDFNEFIEVESSKTDRDVLRMDLLTNSLQILSENSNSAYPQKIFEMGKVFSLDRSEDSETGVKEDEHLTISLIDENIKFTELKQILDYLFKMIDIEYRIENTENNNYINGRVGKIFVGESEVGYIGEIAPRVLKNWKIRMPVVSLEINLDFLFSQNL